MADRSEAASPLPISTRPYMPKGYGILSEDKGSGLLPWTRVRERLERSRNYWIHTTRSDGRPHVKPVWGLWFRERFYFGTDAGSITAQNLSENHSCAVHLESGDDVVILEGTGVAVTDRDLLSQLDDAYYRKYSFHLVMENGGTVFMLDHGVAFAWLERDFVGSATRYNFLR